MSELPLGTRIALYLYSTRNVVACALALLGPALLFAGLIERLWLPITLGLYAAGALLTPSPRSIDRDLTQTLSLDALRDRLAAVIRAARPALPAELAKRLDSIAASVAEVLPRLGDANSAGADLYTVRETVLRYLPETLDNYLKLPPLFRTTRPLRDGRTARDLLAEQLQVLDEQLQQVVGNVARGDAEALLANGRFLEAKFRDRDFLQPAP